MGISRSATNAERSLIQNWIDTYEVPEGYIAIRGSSHMSNRKNSYLDIPHVDSFIEHEGLFYKVVGSGNNYTYHNIGRRSRGYSTVRWILLRPSTEEEHNSYWTKREANEIKKQKKAEEERAKLQEQRVQRLKERFSKDSILQDLRSLGKPYPEGMRELSSRYGITTNTLWDIFKGNI